MDDRETTSADPPYPRAAPPDVLYHAVPAGAVETALREGLHPTRRPHVHLARKAEHARAALGLEDGVVLAVNAAAMHAAGHGFFVSPKATWLVHAVPAEHLAVAG